MFNVGPKHYEGWTCNECNNVTLVDHDEYMCRETRVTLNNLDNTPETCPYLKDAYYRYCRNKIDVI